MQNPRLVLCSVRSCFFPSWRSKGSSETKDLPYRKWGKEEVTSGCRLPRAGGKTACIALTPWRVSSKMGREKLQLLRVFRRITSIGKTVWKYVFTVVNWFLTNKTISRHLDNSVSQRALICKRVSGRHVQHRPLIWKRLMLETAKGPNSYAEAVAYRVILTATIFGLKSSR